MKCRICNKDVGNYVRALFEHLNSDHITSYGGPNMPIEFVNATLILFYGKAINTRMLAKLQREIEEIVKDPGKVTVQLTDKSVEGTKIE